MQKCALSCARLADDGDHLSGHHLKAEVLEKSELATGSVIGLGQILHLNEGRSRRAGDEARSEIESEIGPHSGFPVEAGIWAGEPWNGWMHPLLLF